MGCGLLFSWVCLRVVRVDIGITVILPLLHGLTRGNTRKREEDGKKKDCLLLELSRIQMLFNYLSH